MTTLDARGARDARDARWPPPGGVPVLATARLMLRPFRADDAARVAAFAGDRRVAEGTLAIPHPYPESLAAAWIASLPAQWEAGEGPTWAITDAADATDAIIGAVGLRIWTAHALGELGYWIGVPWWRRGYATEAASAAVTWGVDAASLARVFARCFVGNPTSAALLRRLGFREEGVQRAHFLRLGMRRDVMNFGVLADEWRRGHATALPAPRGAGT